MKKHLRASILSIRNTLSPEERCLKSELIAKRLFDLEEFHKSSNILFYVAARSEVQTEGMIRQAIKQGKRVLVPVTDTENKRLFASELHDFDIELAPGAYGIMEPIEIYQRFVALDEVEMIIVPGAAFDLQGYRIGYGGGYYDRMIESIVGEGSKPALNVCLVGVCFECQLIDAVPIERHDMAVGMIITEERIIRIKGVA
ncbi:5-formyltetrahydrofolate cyclo-ligase [bacterium]|nr:5-formyltetrahydrofolate cyclo-ligase [bacterium]MBU1752307.1 5-formyltetrahydrofolate cyclo-ligase [bacterium]